MSTNLTSIAGALKRVYDSGVVIQQNLKHRALDEIGKASEKYNPGGAGFYFGVNLYGNESVGAINETEAFRTIDNEQYSQGVVTPKVLVGPIEFSGLSAKAADQDEESFVDIVVDALEMSKERLLKDANRQFFGLGTGLLARPVTLVASTATSFVVDSAQYLRANMVVDGFDGATKTMDSVRISNVDKQNNIVYFSTSIIKAMKSTSEIVKENIRDSAPSDGKEMMGLRGIVDDSTDLTTFEGIDATSNAIWRSSRIAAAGANLTSDLLQRLLDDVRILGGEDPDMLIMHNLQRRRYLDIVVPQKRYMDGKLDGGNSKLSFNGIDLYLEEDCQTDTVYALSKKHLAKFELQALEMGRQDGSDIFLREVNSDVFQAYWRWYCNFGSKKRDAHGKITGLGTPSGVA